MTVIVPVIVTVILNNHCITENMTITIIVTVTINLSRHFVTVKFLSLPSPLLVTICMRIRVASRKTTNVKSSSRSKILPLNRQSSRLVFSRTASRLSTHLTGSCTVSTIWTSLCLSVSEALSLHVCHCHLVAEPRNLRVEQETGSTGS